MLTGRLFGGVATMFSPSITISPADSLSRPASIRSSVVWPQPDGPSSAKNSLRWISSDTLSTAITSPKLLLTLRMETTASLWLLTRSCPFRTLKAHGDDRRHESDDDQHRRGGIDVGGDAAPYQRIDLDREGHRLRPGSEEGD